MICARQYALPFPQEALFHPTAFLRGRANEEALRWVERPLIWPGRRLFVQGEAGVGKTHLLHVFAQLHDAVIVTGSELRLFTALPDAASLAVDDADCVGDPKILLHVLNTAAERHMPTVLAGRVAPAQWRMRLPDLASRVRAINVVTLHPPDDDLLHAMLGRLLADHQLTVPERVRVYLLRHLPRTGGALREAVARLDRLALAEGGQVTRALAARVTDAPKAAEKTCYDDCDDLLSAPLSA